MNWFREALRTPDQTLTLSQPEMQRQMYHFVESPSGPAQVVKDSKGQSYMFVHGVLAPQGGKQYFVGQGVANADPSGYMDSDTFYAYWQSQGSPKLISCYGDPQHPDLNSFMGNQNAVEAVVPKPGDDAHPADVQLINE